MAARKCKLTPIEPRFCREAPGNIYDQAGLTGCPDRRPSQYPARSHRSAIATGRIRNRSISRLCRQLRSLPSPRPAPLAGSLSLRSDSRLWFRHGSERPRATEGISSSEPGEFQPGSGGRTARNRRDLLTACLLPEEFLDLPTASTRDRFPRHRSPRISLAHRTSPRPQTAPALDL